MDYDTKQIDVSLKRVNDSHKREKLQEYKRQNAAIAITNLIAEILGRKPSEVRDVIEPPFISMFGNLYTGFEETVATEGAIISDMALDDDLKEAIIAVTARASRGCRKGCQQF